MIEGKLFPIDRANVDTDQIIPTKFLGVVDNAGLGAHCLDGLPGSAELYRTHPDAAIIVARENFGAGSSREHAVWALQARGFKAVIAPSFARIFGENAYNNGFVLAAVGDEPIQKLFSADSARIDVRAERIALPDGTSIPFTLDLLRKEFLLGGGYLAYMHAQIGTIREWESARGR